jgi:hypothetical protein
MKFWFMFLLGTLGYFMHRYTTRSKKDASFDMRFWIKDNWPELIFAFIFDLAAMIILIDPETSIDLNTLQWVPDGMVLPAKLVLSFVIGYGGAYGIYSTFKKKIIDSKA